MLQSKENVMNYLDLKRMLSLVNLVPAGTGMRDIVKRTCLDSLKSDRTSILEETELID